MTADNKRLPILVPARREVEWPKDPVNHFCGRSSALAAWLLLNEVITVVCYGGALVGTVLAGYLLWNIP